MARAFIGLGSNLGDGAGNLLRAWCQLGAIDNIRPVALSSPYSTEPVGMNTRQWFTNAVGVVDTRLPPQELLAIMLRIESALGRDRRLDQDGPGDRTIDLDLLYYNDLAGEMASLILPHPEIANRLFVLAPLAEVAPEHCHPLLGLTPMEMINRLATVLQEHGATMPQVCQCRWPEGKSAVDGEVCQ